MPIVHHPLEFNLGPLPITGFGIAVMLSFVIAQIISQQELLRRGYQKESDAIPDLILACIIGTLIGGRLYYAGIVQQDWSALWGRAGFVFWGGFIGSVIALLARHLAGRSFHSRVSPTSAASPSPLGIRLVAPAAGPWAMTTAGRGAVHWLSCSLKARRHPPPGS